MQRETLTQRTGYIPPADPLIAVPREDGLVHLVPRSKHQASLTHFDLDGKIPISQRAIPGYTGHIPEAGRGYGVHTGPHGYGRDANAESPWHKIPAGVSTSADKIPLDVPPGYANPSCVHAHAISASS